MTGTGKRYPHLYGNQENFNFPIDVCNNDDDIRYEFPVVQDNYYNGGNDGNDRAYLFHAIYLYNGKDQDTEDHPLATYCGTIYHPGKGKGNGFTGCDVTQ